MHLRCEALDTPVWRAWLGADGAGSGAGSGTGSDAGDGAVALGGPGLAALEQLLLRAEADPRCRVLVLASEAEEFCRGMDLQALAPDGDTDASTRDSSAAAIACYARVLGLLRASRAASVCLIEAAASGGGVGLAAACDLVIAGPRASFRLPELFLGLIPAVVLPVLGERVGPARARALALTGDAIDADVALHIGLVDERSDDPTRSLAARLKHLLRCSPDAVARLKRFSAEIAGLALPEALAAGVARTSADVLRPEIRAAIAGFLAGELPPWATRQAVPKDTPA